ncbi:MAG: DNA polymerase III subunit beta [Firmicutes bacterium]|nr:DNA polymerase III subunit beta [Bacillota bacterium]
MRFTCLVADLVSALNIVTRAIAARSTTQIMEGVLLVSCEEGIRLTCTDLALGIETHVAAHVTEEGSVVMPGKLLAEIVRKLPEGQMEVSVNEQNAASIKCAGSRTKLAGLPAEEFPALPEVGESQTIVMPQANLREMIQRSTFAIATDETRPILTGCLLEAEGGDMSIVALDGFRMALRKESFGQELPALSVVVPGKVLNEIARILSDTDAMVSLVWGKSHLMADMGTTRVIARLLDGEFIRYKQILPGEWKTRIIVSKKDMEEALDRASLMAREGKNNLVKLHMEEGTLLITSNAELGDVREEISIEFEGRELDIAFNVRYITDTLRAIEDENIILKFNSNVSPCVLCPTFGDKFIYLALPVRVFSA